jgi:hypothetical protein
MGERVAVRVEEAPASRGENGGALMARFLRGLETKREKTGGGSAHG